MIGYRNTVAVRAVGALRAVRTTRAPVTRTLIVLCCLVFAIGPAGGLNPAHGSGDALLAAQQAYFRRWGVIPAELFTGSARAALTPATALFVHGSWVHLLGNMLFLHVFGAMTEARMGRVRFTLFYTGCGYLALVGYALAHSASDQTLVGASGAISAVLGAFLYLFPRARVTSVLPFLFFLPLRLPAWVVLPFWAGLQWLAAGRAGQGPGVAYLAHVVGFGLGFLFAWVRYGGPGRRGRRPGGAVVGAGRTTRVKASPAPAPEGENQP
ncbi:rhomboid family intramembrane serine protease [Streptomyces sp. SID8499]|uniref:rhomboid family intramembrane serine protease n=1 Tax=Streptomyces sp. SID8499 TaxID=2706106 RepID=UPI0013C8A801|nr:rhomboid family intramembrane serine protease [Streptomyces sp. SID8499]NED36405.1 rhomboid family intramembrane serine protease [Streptomyces sp. SID8499]NED72139.1 rhomboid family intramembrane serine protease [Streptomyces sp. SID9944]